MQRLGQDSANKVADSFGLIFLTPAQSSSAVLVVSRDPRNQKLFNIGEVNMNLLKTTKSIEEVKTQIDEFFKQIIQKGYSCSEIIKTPIHRDVACLMQAVDDPQEETQLHEGQVLYVVLRR